MKKFFAQTYLWLLLTMLYAPIVIIAIFSFTEAKVLGNWTGFSTKLYTSLFSGGVHHSLLSAIENTLIIALVAAVISTFLGSIAAIGIHNLPEGIAAGVSFGSGNASEAMLIAGGIALQNIPEGMVIIGPMLAAGVSPRRTFLCALATGLVEVIGTFLGYFAVTVASAILPFALAFAGGTMLYVISDEMIPETHHGDAQGVTHALLAGFCLMLGMSHYL